MFKKKTNKPLNMKKSKAAKQREFEEQEEYDNNYFMVNSNRRNLSSEENHMPQRKRKKQYQEIEYTDYEDQFNERRYYDNSGGRGKYQTETEVSEYTVDERRYRHRRPETEFYESESECSDCSEECLPCERRRRRSEAGPWDNTGYSREQRRPKQRRGWGSPNGRNVHPHFDDEWPYVRKNNYVYLAHEPISHQAFRADETNEQRQPKTIAESETEFYDDELEGAHSENQTDNATIYYRQYDEQSDNSTEYSPRYEDQTDDAKVYRHQFKGDVKGNKSNGHQYKELPYGNGGFGGQYQVYAAHTEDKVATVFAQQRGKSYKREEGLPVLALSESPMSPHLTGSEVVYLPVVVMESRMPLPDNKVMHPEELMRSFKEEAEKPLETNLQIYAATNLDQGNIFQQKQQDFGMNSLANMQDISLYTVTQEEGHPLQEKKSGRSLIAAKKTESGAGPSINKYPVQKSYINVALSKLKSRSTHSLIGSTGKGRIKGSGFYSKAYKKDKQLRKNMKQKKNKIANENSSDIGPESIISIISPSKQENEYQSEKENSTLKNIRSKGKNFNDAAIDSQDTTAKTRQNMANREAQVTNLEKDISEENKSEDRRKSIPKTKASNADNIYNTSGKVKMPDKAARKSNSLSVIKINKTKTEDDPDQDGNRQPSPVKKTKSEESLGNVTRKKNIMQSIFRRKKGDHPVPLQENKSSSSIQNLSLDKEDSKRKPRSIKRMPSKEKRILRKTATGMEDQQALPLIIWGINCSYLVHLFQLLITVLGLNTHDSMLDILDCFEK